MKNISKKNKIIALIIILILIAGTIMLIAKGFNKSITYSNSTRIECYIPKGYEKKDIKQIADEAFSDKNIKIEDIEKLNQIVSIRIKNYNQEELTNFKNKIAEKYEMNDEEIDIHEVKVPTTRISTIVSPYILPISIVTALSCIYIALRNIKNKEMLKKVLRLIITLIVVVGLYFSIIVIARIPVNEYMMPIALSVYVATLLLTVIKLNKN